MGNTSKRKPKRAPGGAPRPPTTPPRFAVVRDEEHNAIEIVNVEAVTFARFSVVNGDRPRLALTLGDFSGFNDPDSMMVYYDNTAADLLAHLILCGVDIEGAARALAAARGDVYRDYFKATPDELPEPVAYGLAQCAECELACDMDACPGWIPGGLDDDCGAFVQAVFEEGGEAEAERLASSALFPNGIAPPPTTYDTDGIRAGCDCPTCRQVKHEHAPRPPIAVEEHAAELAQIREREREPLPPRAIGEIRAGSVDEEPPTLNANAAKQWEATRASCAFGENCKRFPACGDCSLYALDRACAAAHDGDPLTIDGDRRVVHVEHVEQVSGETSAALLARVERCGVFVGLKGRGVVPGDLWCGVGHEMTDPACALCPYLRIYAPPL
jgi:hypothetical protein